ncbi:MAG: RagB/SusD family nutrient uptake outer membrane protein [Paludibacter sp.]|nr:RagB/SusD family nutrient uptake outer membrane protein [Paludibacter sp.]MDD4198088.1 RagB/SusD family nutrient uptake outer membrane protein [Paludibacter sp.]MDD4427670.1 RagB/SusD family nutrient uptake outer membrane protein [Paludibacter sp.]
MNSRIRNIVLSALIVLLSGCVDLLQEPKSFVTPENMLYDKTKMENLADALYNALWYNNYGYNCRLQWANLRADDIIAGQLTKADPRLVISDELRFDATVSEKDVTELYKCFYKVIQGANEMIKGIELSDTESYDVRKKYLAEARFMRAFAYFNLVRLFGDVPAITDPTSSQDIFGNKSIGRNQVIDIYEKIIIPDLLFAEENMDNYGRKSNNSTASKYAAKVCLADVYLNMAGWPLKQTDKYALAKDKAYEVVGKYKLVSDYGELWADSIKSSNEEHIFALNHSVLGKTASNYGISYVSLIENGTSWQDYLADSTFFENHPADKRRDFNFVSAYAFRAGIKYRKSSFRSYTILKQSAAIDKYRDYGITSAQTGGITPIYRYADVLLIYAEAQNRADGGPNTISEGFINDLRRRAYREKFTETNPKLPLDNPANRKINKVMADDSDGIISKPANGDVQTGLSMEVFEKVVWDERGWEFFAEFKRWFELVRTERVKEANLNPRVIAAGNLDNINNRYLPLPIKEVDLCGWKNNPGY